MRLLRRQRPKVEAMEQAGDVPGLVAASRYRDLVYDRDGHPLDLGAEVREKAVRALGRLGGRGADQVLVNEALRDPSDRVRSASVEALRERRNVGGLARALEWLPEGGGRARALLDEALSERTEPGGSLAVVTALLRRLDGVPLGDADVATAVAHFQSESSPQARAEVIEVLLSSLADDREVVAARAERLLVRLPADSVDPLIRELTTGRARIRAASALGAIKDVRAIDALIRALGDPDPEVRAAGCDALGRLRDSRSVAPLLGATRDPVYAVRLAASSALDGLGAVGIAVGVTTLIRQMLADGVVTDGALVDGHARGGVLAPGETLR